MNTIKPESLMSELMPRLNSDPGKLSNWGSKRQMLGIDEITKFTNSTPETEFIRMRSEDDLGSSLSAPRAGMFVTRPEDMVLAQMDPVAQHGGDVSARLGYERKEVQSFANGYKQLVGVLFAVKPEGYVWHEATSGNVLKAIERTPDFTGDLAQAYVARPVSVLMDETVKLSGKPNSAVPADVAVFRALLKEYYGINEHWTGDGFTRSWDGQRGVREYLILRKDGPLTKQEWPLTQFESLATIPTATGPRRSK